jgi:hypothetical protein
MQLSPTSYQFTPFLFHHPVVKLLQSYVPLMPEIYTTSLNLKQLFNYHLGENILNCSLLTV